MQQSLHQDQFQKHPVSKLSPQISQLSEAAELRRGVSRHSLHAQGLSHIVQSLLPQLNKFSHDDLRLSRLAVHFMIIVLVSLSIALSNLPWTWHTLKIIRPPRQTSVELPAEPILEEKGIPLTLPTKLNNLRSTIIGQAAVPHTIIPERAREEILTYAVAAGDTVTSIAAAFGLTPETIVWSNSSLEANPDTLQVGQELAILPINGVYHQVGQADTLEGIAATYKVAPAAIIAYPLNELAADEPVIEPGQWLVVPGGSKPFVPRPVTAYTGSIPKEAISGSGAFGWPASGVIFQEYWAGHPGLDIAAPLGTPVFAADAGYVVAASWDDTGYGYTVVLDHGNGFQTLYAHVQAFSVKVGDDVMKGQQIAEVGSSGNSTGPHVHFEVRQGTVQRNPYGFLP